MDLSFLRKSCHRWALSCLFLYHRFGGQQSTLLHPPTSVLFLLPLHTTGHLPPNHTLPPHNHTIPLFTQDLTPKPAVHMCGAQHTRISKTWKCVALTFTIGARQRLLWLTSFSLLSSVCTTETPHLPHHPRKTLTCNHLPRTHTLHTACQRT